MQEHSTDFTVVWREGRIENTHAHFVDPAILPDGSVYNTAEPSDWGRDLQTNTGYRTMIALIAFTARQIKNPWSLAASSTITKATSSTFFKFSAGTRKKIVAI